MSTVLYEASPVSSETLERAAIQLREIFGAPDEPFLPIIQILEWGLVRAIGDDYTFEVCDMDEMGADHGRTYPDQKRLTLRRDVYEGVVAHRGRDRFTATHELAHLVLHSEKRLSRRLDDQPVKIYRDPEWHRLAGSLLMPRGMMSACKTVMEVTDNFGVSQDAAIVRMKQLGMPIKYF